MKFFLKKNINGSLSPAGEEAEEYLKKVKLKSVVSCEIKRPRNYKYLQKFHVFLKMVLDNQETFKTTEQLLDAIKLDIGCVIIYRDIKGNVFQKPGSIAFANMKEEEFEKVFSRAINTVLANLMHGTTEEEIREEVEQYIRFS